MLWLRTSVLVALAACSSAPEKHTDSNSAQPQAIVASITLRETGLIAEGLAFDAKTQRFFVGSVRRRAIFSVEPDGSLVLFSKPRDGLFGVFGMAIDAPHRRLFACTTHLKEMGGPGSQAIENGGVVEYDLETQELGRKALLAQDGRPHVLGDLALAPNGTVYATDSRQPAIYALAPDSQELVKAFDTREFDDLQGIAVAPDGAKLFVSDYRRGIFAVDVASGACTLLELPENEKIGGVDGIYLHGDELLGVYNAQEPCAILRLKFDATRSRFVEAKLIERGGDVRDATLGAVVGDRFHFIVSSGWAELDQKFELAPADQRKPPTIRRLDL